MVALVIAISSSQPAQLIQILGISGKVSGSRSIAAALRTHRCRMANWAADGAAGLPMVPARAGR